MSSSIIYLHTYLCFLHRLRDETDSVQVRSNCERRLEELRVKSEEVQSLLVRNREKKKEMENANDVTTKELREVRYVPAYWIRTYVCVRMLCMLPDHPHSILTICTYTYIRMFNLFKSSLHIRIHKYLLCVYTYVRTYVHTYVSNTFTYTYIRTYVRTLYWSSYHT